MVWQFAEVQDWNTDWKAKSNDHSYLILLFFNTGSCFTNGAVVHMAWRQIGFKSVDIWRILRYKSGDKMLSTSQFFQSCDFFSRVDSLEETFCQLYQLPPTNSYPFGHQIEANLPWKSELNHYQTWTHFYQEIRRLFTTKS